MTAADSYTPDSATASLEILTGPARGTASWLAGPTLDVSLDETDMIRIAEAGSEPLQDGVVARLHRSGESYEIEAIEENPLWINGERVESKQLEQRDLIEFGDNGPLSRYRLHRQGDRIRRSLGDMLDDAIDYTRASRKPRITRLQRAIVDFLYDFAVKTTVIFRIGVILALILLAWIAYQQYRSSIMLQQQAESSAHRLEDFSRSLTRTSEEALRPADLNRLRQELRHSLSDAAQRLEQLEQRGAASTRVIAAATPSIVSGRRGRAAAILAAGATVADPRGRRRNRAPPVYRYRLSGQ
jgi:ABC-type multidrug transport system fused ATPase/permease subunit